MAVVTASLLGLSWLWPAFASWVAGVQIIPAIQAMSVVTFVVWLLVTLMFGRVYCSSVCPFGTLQDIFARIPRLTSRQASRRRYRYRRPAYRFQYAMLIVALIALMGGIPKLIALLDPYSVYTHIIGKTVRPLGECAANGIAAAGDATGLWSLAQVKIVVGSAAGMFVASALLVIVGAVAAATGRSICNTVCPVGTTLGLVSRYSIFQVEIDTDRCIHCNRCVDVCKASCINPADSSVDGARCVTCFDCLPVCPNDAIRYTSARKRLSDVMMQRVDKPGKAAVPDAAECPQPYSRPLK